MRNEDASDSCSLWDGCGFTISFSSDHLLPWPLNIGLILFPE